MGFHSVYQVSITDPPSKYSNQNVMEYLRRIVPRMFQVEFSQKRFLEVLIEGLVPLRAALLLAKSNFFLFEIFLGIDRP